ncbi:MAG: UDP-3-O-(3-hydroxymyristoyl)glucosamine N-acyltransferase [Candidatus Sumerlaeota bacterium]|nr:UDP-3-O-(3-hydroxymyristoyl)glucosamine N-acyltransferase [Candidatus Sumerlaeota bacterium]
MSKYKLRELREKLEAEMSPSAVDDLEVSGLTTLETAGASDISFVTSEKFRPQAEATKAAAIITPAGFELPGKSLLQVKNVWQAVIQCLDLFYPEPKPTCLTHPTACIAQSARLGKGVTVEPMAVIEDGAQIGDGSIIGALCYIGRNVTIGEKTLLHPRVSVMADCVVGSHVILHPGAVIGSDGFKFEVIRIGRGTKLDNLIQIAHNVKVGPYCMMAAQVGIAGSTKVGAGCIFGGQVGIRDNVTIGNNVMLAAQSGVNKDIPDGAQMFGAPAMPAREGMKIVMAMQHLPEMMQTIRDLKKRIESLEKESQR